MPEGGWDPPTGHMRYPGTITLPEDRFVELLVNAGRSLKASGFKNILFLGESGGNRNGMREAATRLNDLWKGAATAYWVDDYYTKSHADQNKWITANMKIPEDQIGGHANLLDTSELLFVAPKHIRRDRLTGNDYPNNGVSGDPAKSTPEIGKVFLQIKVDNSLAQIKRMMSGAEPPVAAPQQRQGGGGGGSVAAQNAAAPPPGGPTMNTAPASKTPTKAPDTVFIDELTWEENRDAMKAGKTVFIVPIGGTEKNGYHMVLGKHNYTVTHAANLMARKLGNALVVPTLQYVPEGDPDRQNSGAISLPSPAYDGVLDAIARSLKSARRHRHPVHRRQRRQSEWHDRGRHQVERGMEGRHDARLRVDGVLQRRPRALPRVDGCGVRLRRRHHRQPRRHQRHRANAARAAGGHSQEHADALGRSERLGRVGRSDESDRRDRPHGHSVQGQRRDQSVPAVEESAAAARPRRQSWNWNSELATATDWYLTV